VQHPRATPEGATRPQKTRFRHKEGKPTMQHPRATPEGATYPKETRFRSMEGIPPCNTPEPPRMSNLTEENPVLKHGGDTPMQHSRATPE